MIVLLHMLCDAGRVNEGSRVPMNAPITYEKPIAVRRRVQQMRGVYVQVNVEGKSSVPKDALSNAGNDERISLRPARAAKLYGRLRYQNQKTLMS